MKQRPTSRRQAIKLVAGAAGSVALVSLPLGACGAAGGRADPSEISRVPLASLTEGTRVRLDHHGEPVELTRDGEVIVARSLICTHQYCKMFWHSGTNGYRCPCHGAVFSPDGRAASGPISTPMWTLPVRVEGDELVVGGATG